MVRMIVLNDNVPGPGLRNDWGWSLYIDTSMYKVLFDADTYPGIIEYNARILGVDLTSLDFAFLSHRHGDHSGGFELIGRIKPGLKVYVTPDAVNTVEPHGLDPVPVHKAMRLVDDFWSTGPLRSGSLYEHGLVFQTIQGPVLVVGCSHPGVDNLARKALDITGANQLFMVIGGFHDPSTRTLDRLAEMTRHICPAHCSGEKAKKYVEKEYNDKYCRVRTGTIIEINRGLIIKY